MSEPRAPSPTRRGSRIFIRKMFGYKTWREFERDLRRLRSSRRPIDTNGVEAHEGVRDAERAAAEENDQ
jgi:hypothetical protein